MVARYRVSVDTGGTFSDFVVVDETSGHYRILKVPSTPDDPARAVLNGLDLLASQGVPPEAIEFFLHGTTVGTNTLLEERGARTGLAITAGFRGIYETMEQSRPFGRAIFDLGYEKPRLLAPESRTVEFGERIGPRGEVRTPLNESCFGEAIARLEAEQVEALAVCFLFAFMNPEHEARFAAAVRAAHPEWWVSTSSELLPQVREYYRLSTTVMNAYVAPVVGRYVARLNQALDARGVAVGRRFTMQSNGGSVPFGRTAERAVSTILSGPAGGVTAGIALSAAAGIDTGEAEAPRDIITFDMGGTSCDVALVREGQPIITDRSTVDERHIGVPMLDIKTVSAGGGTLASVDVHGALHVGPRSAGALPGPACYGRGGSQATVTDADVVLGYLDPIGLLGGELAIDTAAAERAVRTGVAEPLGIDLLRAAEGIVRVVNVKMAEAIKAISTERGFDLRDFTLVPFGGAGPVHACQIALDLGIGRVLVPPAPGATSALGLLLSDVKHDYVRSRLSDVDEVGVHEANAIFGELEVAARAQLRQEGFRGEAVRLRYFLDMRYAGQGYENPVPVDGVPLKEGDLAGYRARFDAIHRECHGHNAPGQPVEIVSYRIQAFGIVPRIHLARLEPADGTPPDDARLGERPAVFASLGRAPVTVPVYDRARLKAGHTFDGPAIVEQYDATTVVCPEQTVEVDPIGNLLIRTRPVTVP
jgi:N-methylhydantoinase A